MHVVYGLQTLKKSTRMFSKLPILTILFVYIRIQFPSARNEPIIYDGARAMYKTMTCIVILHN